MSTDIEINAIDRLKFLKWFAFQVDKLTDISRKTQLLAFFRFVNEKNNNVTFFLLHTIIGNDKR